MLRVGLGLNLNVFGPAQAHLVLLRSAMACSIAQDELSYWLDYGGAVVWLWVWVSKSGSEQCEVFW